MGPIKDTYAILEAITLNNAGDTIICPADDRVPLLLKAHIGPMMDRPLFVTGHISENPDLKVIHVLAGYLILEFETYRRTVSEETIEHRNEENESGAKSSWDETIQHEIITHPHDAAAIRALLRWYPPQSLSVFHKAKYAVRPYALKEALKQIDATIGNSRKSDDTSELEARRDELSALLLTHHEA